MMQPNLMHSMTIGAAKAVMQRRVETAKILRTC